MVRVTACGLVVANDSVDSPARKSLLSWLPGSSESGVSMDIDTNSMPSEPVPEVEIYLRLLIIYNLLSSPEANSKALQLAKETGEKILQLNRRSMDTIAAKVWYAVDRAYELGGELADARPYVIAFGSERTRAYSS